MLDALLWNLLLTAALALVLTATCRLAWLQNRPALRHWLWLLLLSKLVTPPLVHVPLLPSVVNRTAVPITTPPAIAAQKSEIAIEPPAQTAGDDAADVVILAPAIPAARRAANRLPQRRPMPIATTVP